MTVRFILAGDGNQSISFLIWPESGQYRRHRAATEPFILFISVQTRRGFCHRRPWDQIQWLQSITAPGAVSSLHTPGLEIVQRILLRRQHFLIIITILFEKVSMNVNLPKSLPSLNICKQWPLAHTMPVMTRPHVGHMSNEQRRPATSSEEWFPMSQWTHAIL